MNTAPIEEAAAPSCSFELDDTLNVWELRDAFLKKERLSVPGILRAANSQTLFEDLSATVPWCLTFAGSGEERTTIESSEVSTMDAHRRRAVAEIAYSGGGTDGAHLFYSSTYHSPIMTKFSAFLNSGAFLQFLRDLTGIDSVRRVKTSAACYRAGHFYGFHKDRSDQGEQVGTVIFYVTPKWRYQWGGMLQFKDTDGQIDESIFPRFNSMTVMRANQAHAVSCVSPFAAIERFSIGGKLLT
jgi:hypothetical protein